MDESKPTIEYTYAHLYLKPENFLGSNWKEGVGEGRLDQTGVLDLLVEDDYFMQMHGISIPISSMGLITKPQEVVQAVRNLVGDCKKSLSRYSDLVNERIIQDTLYFTSEGFYDYSHTLHNPKGEGVGSRIDYANSVSCDLESYFPDGVLVPKGKLEFVPTFEKIRSMQSFVRKVSNEGYVFSGNTFQERIERFLQAYDSVKAHEKWAEDEDRRIRHSERVATVKLSHRERIPKFAKVVFENSI